MQVTAEVSRVGDIVVRALENRGTAIAEVIGQKGAEITRTLSQTGIDVTRGISDSSEQAARLLAESSDAFRGQVESGTSASVEALTAMNDQLRGEIAGLLGRLGETNGSLREVVVQTETSLASLNNQLGERIGQFASSAETASSAAETSTRMLNGQIGQLASVASTVLRDVSQLSERFDAQARLLGAAAEQVEDMQQRLDASFDARREVIEALVNHLASKTEDMDNLVKSFTGLLDDNLGVAEGRAREIGRVLVESTNQTTQAIGEQAETLRLATGKERERTTHAMRSAYEQATHEMQALFREAAERFETLTTGMKAMSAEIQRELAETRDQLSRGMVEIPKETQENAAAMRRVVADQIKALAELNDIVAKSGRAFDVAEPSPAAARRVVREEPTVPLRTAVAELPRPEAKPEPVREAPPRQRAPEPRAAEPRRETPARAEAPKAADRSGGWLSDLLARASTDEQSGQPMRPAQRRAPAPAALDNLDALSSDIARMVDHEAVADLWDRWRRGERNVFSRRLYTAQGQQTFDELRRRYRRDTEFRDTVDRYVDEFQRLLADVDRNDRDGSLSRSYLTSETGKVFTLLAHASGRFD